MVWWWVCAVGCRYWMWVFWRCEVLAWGIYIRGDVSIRRHASEVAVWASVLFTSVFNECTNMR